MNKSLFHTFYFLSASLLVGACASQGMPSGGPKDIAPPKLMSVVPKDQSTQYKGNTVQLVFDEYLDLKNIKQELTITPSLKGDYEYKLRKNILTITFDSTLTDSTTYVLDFGEAIRDANERNVRQNTKLAFSTGPTIDTFYVRGKVANLLNHKPLIKCAVALYREKDTVDIDKGKPYYYTRTDSTGNYFIGNVRAGRYKIYALEEKKNANLIYDNNDELIGFDTTLVDLVSSPYAQRDLYVTQYDIKPFRIAAARPVRQYFEIKANKGIYSYQVTIPDTAFARKVTYVTDGDVLRFFNLAKLAPSDTAQVLVQLADSTGNLARDTAFIKFNEVRDQRRGKIEAKEFPATVNKLKPSQLASLQPSLKFTKPVARFRVDTTLYQVDKDTNKYKLTEADFAWNENRTELRLVKKIPAKESLSLKFPKGTFFSVEPRDTLDAKTLGYTTRQASETGIVSGEVRSPFPNFIVQVTGQKVPSYADGEDEQVNARRFKFEFVNPGEKRIRIFIDVNGNGRWDNGDFKNRIPPEPVYLYSERLPVKPNWTLEDEVVDTTQPEVDPDEVEERERKAKERRRPVGRR
jgi:hypothetical protein